MADSSDHKPGRKKKPPVEAHQIQGGKYLGNIIDLLRRLRSHQDCPNRILHFDEYVAYLLLYFFTPVLTSMRALQQASNLDLVAEKFGLRRFSLGSFSEAGSLFDPSLLEPIIQELADRIAITTTDERLATLPLPPVVIDGSILQALPKMVWALWLDEEHRAAKMHVEYCLLRGIPTKATITAGQHSERAVLRETLVPGKLYVLDRGYADYALMADILAVGSSFVVRIDNNASYQVLEERPLSPQARQAGVERDLIVRLGSTGAPELHNHRIRLVQVHMHSPPRRGPDRVSSKKTFRTGQTEHTLLLATDLLDLDAELIAAMYSHRWEIEIFFRWFKKVLEADHLLSLSKNGLTLVVYCALIASLLVTLWTGRKPTKRTFEMICFYLMGWAKEEELAAHIEKLKTATK